ncbi:ankyrin repeat domain-containing protein [Flavobacterium sp. LS1R47]|uniref:Ankyrin repeat domain-containing protein n=1 Tax=Flavobacterium frigoritolerans TaxID=2987686 RepID=A0A9X3CA52_9FLAO|nr:ankyrin repeat domain-containing protein [Flavobacterium frigoritolerans]MCV9934426.1 ankyrin repeat domain-containing protein [Flavobacterium frigoritolerans]
MKKSIVFLGVAFMALTHVVQASSRSTSFKLLNTEKHIVQGYDRSPLNVAISRGDIETVKKFIEYGANVNKVLNGMSPLMAAARYNQVEIMKFLVSKGAELEAENEKGYTALKYAEVSKAKEAIAFLKTILKK